MTPTQRRIAIEYEALKRYLARMRASQRTYTPEAKARRAEDMKEIRRAMRLLRYEYAGEVAPAGEDDEKPIPPPPPPPPPPWF